MASSGSTELHEWTNLLSWHIKCYFKYIYRVRTVGWSHFISSEPLIDDNYCKCSVYCLTRLFDVRVYLLQIKMKLKLYKFVGPKYVCFYGNRYGCHRWLFCYTVFWCLCIKILCCKSKLYSQCVNGGNLYIICIILQSNLIYIYTKAMYKISKSVMWTKFLK